MANELEDLELDDIMQSLTEEELSIVQQILSEVSSEGESSTLDEIWKADYEELPVDIETFITDKRYLGNSFVTDDGDVLVYPYWRKFLAELFAEGSGKFECAFSGAIGLGKSTIACIGLAYILHKLLCLKDPARYYKLTKGSRIGIGLINLSLDAAYGVGYQKLQGMLQQSPWFLERGELRGLKSKTYFPGKNIDIIAGAKMEHFIGRDIFAVFMDEMDYMKGADGVGEANKVMNLYTTIKRRIESRYMRKGGTIPGMLFLVSSKRSSADFLENYLKENKHKPYLAIVDEPVWVVKASQGMYSGEKFKVAVGNKFLKSKILGPDEDPNKYLENGQRVIDVPIEYKEAFELNINSALMDIAGIALDSNSKFLDYERLKRCYRDYLSNPFTKEEIILGFDDDSEIKDYLDLSKLSTVNRSKPHYIHWDTSKKGDATGLAMLTTEGGKSVRRLSNGTVSNDFDVINKLVFGIKIRPVQGSEIPFYKIRNFIYYLRSELGFNISVVSCDSYQSVDTLQQFTLKGFNAKTLSVDRSMEPYNALRNAINEGRFIMPYIECAESDFLDIEHDMIRNKVDHSVTGAKDLSDAIAACVFHALTDKQNRAYQGATTSDLVVTDSDDMMDLDDWVVPSSIDILDDDWGLGLY